MWKILLESLSCSSILLEIVESLHTLCQGPHFTPSVFRVVFLHTEANGEIFFSGSVRKECSEFLCIVIKDPLKWRNK